MLVPPRCSAAGIAAQPAPGPARRRRPARAPVARTSQVFSETPSAPAADSARALQPFRQTQGDAGGMLVVGRPARAPPLALDEGQADLAPDSLTSTWPPDSSSFSSIAASDRMSSSRSRIAGSSARAEPDRPCACALLVADAGGCGKVGPERLDVSGHVHDVIMTSLLTSVKCHCDAAVDCGGMDDHRELPVESVHSPAASAHISHAVIATYAAAAAVEVDGVHAIAGAPAGRVDPDRVPKGVRISSEGEAVGAGAAPCHRVGRQHPLGGWRGRPPRAPVPGLDDRAGAVVGGGGRRRRGTAADMTGIEHLTGATVDQTRRRRVAPACGGRRAPTAAAATATAGRRRSKTSSAPGASCTSTTAA